MAKKKKDARGIRQFESHAKATWRTSPSGKKRTRVKVRGKTKQRIAKWSARGEFGVQSAVFILSPSAYRRAQS